MNDGRNVNFIGTSCSASGAERWYTVSNVGSVRTSGYTLRGRGWLSCVTLEKAIGATCWQFSDHWLETVIASVGI